MLHPVDYDIADAIRAIDCVVPKIDGWERKIAQRAGLPMEEYELLVSESIDRLRDVGVITLVERTVYLQDGQVCLSSDEWVGLAPYLTERVSVEMIMLDTQKLREVRQACGKDLFREPVTPDLVSV